jgi:predicted Zn-dependent peptidase
LGLGIEFSDRFPLLIAQVTPQDVLAAACKYLQAPYLSLVGPEEIINLASLY